MAHIVIDANKGIIASDPVIKHQHVCSNAVKSGYAHIQTCNITSVIWMLQVVQVILINVVIKDNVHMSNTNCIGGTLFSKVRSIRLIR